MSDSPSYRSMATADTASGGKTPPVGSQPQVRARRLEQILHHGESSVVLPAASAVAASGVAGISDMTISSAKRERCVRGWWVPGGAVVFSLFFERGYFILVWHVPCGGPHGPVRPRPATPPSSAGSFLWIGASGSWRLGLGPWGRRILSNSKEQLRSN